MNKHLKQIILAATAAAMILMSMTGCGDKTTNDSTSSGTSSTSSTSVSSTAQSSTPPSTNSQEKSGTIVDREGNTITLPEKMDAIISMAPSITETLVHLGLADKLVAVDAYSAAVEGLPEGIPTFDIMTPDVEQITALKPDILMATGMSKAKGDDPYQAVTDLGTRMTYIPSSVSIEDIREDVRFIGQVVGKEEEVEVLLSDMQKKIDEIVAKIGDKKSGKTVYFEIAGMPNLYSFGSGTFLNEIIDLLGAKNILADQNSWVTVSEEAVLKANPDVIFTNIDYVEDPVGDILGRNGWDALNAVKNNQVFKIDSNASSRSNENIVIAIEEMAKALYPDLF